MRARRTQRRVQLAEIVAAPLQRVDLAKCHVRDERAQFRIETEEMALVVRAVVRAERLVLAVDRRRELAQQYMVRVAREQRIPVGTP